MYPIQMLDSRRDRMVLKLRFKIIRDCDISDIKILDYDQQCDKVISELKIIISRDCDSRGIEHKVMIIKDVIE